MPTVSIRIPQIGEGLQEARLVAVLKKPGEKVKRDEAIYQMETDKAVMDVESPHEGILMEWLAPEDSILPIGAEVARMEVADAGAEVASNGHGGGHAAAPVEAAARGGGAAVIPPRSRAYAKEKGVSDEDLQKLAEAKGKVMPADIDEFLAGGSVGAKSSDGGGKYSQSAVPQKQRVLNSRMVRATQLVVPGTISLAVSWEAIHDARQKVKEAGSDFQPSAFTYFAYAVAKAAKEHASLRTSLVGDDTYRTYHALSMGVAVSLPGDELVLAVIEDADALSWRDFANRAKEQIDIARGGKDQANEAVTLSLTNMQNFGLRDAVPVVVPPAAATLFLGEVYHVVQPHEGGFTSKKMVNIALTFDHRILNGVGAANFMNAVRTNMERIAEIAV
jgi:pyruvate dehydrogenase E2 component (dihydrolipoamide acetyltransferase)